MELGEWCFVISLTCRRAITLFVKIKFKYQSQSHKQVEIPGNSSCGRHLLDRLIYREKSWESFKVVTSQNRFNVLVMTSAANYRRNGSEEVECSFGIWSFPGHSSTNSRLCCKVLDCHTQLLHRSPCIAEEQGGWHIFCLEAQKLIIFS